MDEKNAKSAMSSSLLARNVYCVCFPERDGLESLRSELAAARKRFYEGGRKTVKVGKAELSKGFDGKLQGKLTRHGLFWKKTSGKAAGRIALEEAFSQATGYMLVKRDFRNVITSRVFFDKEGRWLRSEYYEPWDPINAKVTFKPSDASDKIERFDRLPEGQNARSVELCPLPYLDGTAEQSILNARFGEPGLVVSTSEGEFCYCPKRETELRRKALQEIQDGTIVLMPAWEVKDGALSGDAGEEATNVTFTSLEEYARIEPTSEEKEDGPELQPAVEITSGPLSGSGTEEFTPAPEEAEGDKPGSDQAPEEAAADGPVEAEAPEQPAAEAENAGEAGNDQPDKPLPEARPVLSRMECRESVRDGQLSGRGRTEQQNGLTAYDGDYRDGRREGFGAYYYKGGNLCYAGSWKDDKRDGVGVSFRDTDHALHISKWKDGKPGDFVSLFDSEGNLRYGGRIENGKKEGVGVSFNQADGTVFVGQWAGGVPTGLGSAFDREGNLLYYGGWKDGKRDGQGTEFDKNGGIVFDGEWKNGKYHNGILYQKMTQADDLEDDGEPSWDM